MVMQEQWVFRQERTEPYVIPLLSRGRFQYCRRPTDACRIVLSLFRLFGAGGTIKMLVKLATPRREFFCITLDGRIANYGEVMMSRCRYYPVEHGAAVIGPVWTGPDHRRQGLATAAVQMALNELMRRGISVHYIDTATTNTSMRHVIDKCGFGEAVQTFEKAQT